MSEILRNDVDPIETQDWLQALDSLVREEGIERAQYIVEQLIDKARLKRCFITNGNNH